jgi:hypothetical protein
VPFKNKWLRDTAQTLHFSDSLPISSSLADPQILILRAAKDLKLNEPVTSLALTLQSRYVRSHQQAHSRDALFVHF